MISRKVSQLKKKSFTTSSHTLKDITEFIEVLVCTSYSCTVGVHGSLEKSLKMLDFSVKNSRPLKVLRNR